MYRHRFNAQRGNLIGIPMEEVDKAPPEVRLNSNPAQSVLQSNSRKRKAERNDGILSKKPRFDTHNFNKPNHCGHRKKVSFSLPNTKLVIRQIPPELNNISRLNEHFSKFGTIVNLQVAYNNDPEGALVQFACPKEAKRAIQSTEAVLNNRFIEVHWHREDEPAPLPAHSVSPLSVQQLQRSAAITLNQSVKDRLGPLSFGNPEPLQDPSSSSQSSQNAARASVKERLGFSAPETSAGTVFSTSTRHNRTFYNPAALKTGQKGALFGTWVSREDALKKHQEVLKLQQDVRKKKQEILEKHIETQKLLISKLEKNKCMKPEHKAQIMQMLTTLTNSISKLQENKAKAQAPISDLFTPGDSVSEVPTHAVVDPEPRALEISGFTEADRSSRDDSLLDDRCRGGR